MSNEPPAHAASTLKMRDVLNSHDFRLLWLGQIISDFGDSLTTLALLLLVNKLTGSTTALATMAIILALPQITVGLLAGVYVDRHDRKRIMIVADLLRGLLVLGFTFVRSPDQIWLLYTIGLLQATVGTFFTPARSALLPQIVPQEGLLTANSMSQTSRIICGVLGTATAGLLIGATERFWPAFAIDSLTFFASVVLISRMKVRSQVSTPAAIGARTILQQLIDGLTLIVRTRALMGTIVVASVTMLGLGAVNILFVPLLINDLHTSPTWFGVVELAQTLGMVVSASLVAVVASRVKPVRIVSSGAIALGVAVGLLSLVSSVWHVILVMFVLGWIVTPLQAAVTTLTQTTIPDEVRGRTGATLNAVVTTGSLLSMAMAGLLGDAMGIRNVFILAGLIVISAGLAGAWIFRQPSRVAPFEVSA